MRLKIRTMGMEMGKNDQKYLGYMIIWMEE
jgi:hypothetical protein